MDTTSEPVPSRDVRSEENTAPTARRPPSVQIPGSVSTPAYFRDEGERRVFLPGSTSASLLGLLHEREADSPSRLPLLVATRDLASDITLSIPDHRHREDASPFMRALVVFLVGIGIHAQYTMRCNISVAITVAPEQYHWPDGWTGPVLSAFFIGYICGQLPMSAMAKRYGARRVLALAVTATSLLNAAMPLFLHSPPILFALRVLSGLTQAATFPASYQLLAAWTLPTEQTVVISVMHVLGDTGGTIAGFIVSQWLLDHGGSQFVDGLSLVFWVWSAMGLSWVFVWLLLIPERELDADEYIDPADSKAVGGNKKVPWRLFLTHPMLLVLYCNHAAANFINYSLLTELPTFLQESLHLSTSLQLAATALPYVANVLVMMIISLPADMLIQNGFDRTTLRRTCQSVGLVVPGALLLATTFAEDGVLAVVLLTAAVGIYGLTLGAGYSCAYLECSPLYTGQIFSVGNAIGTIPGIAAPIIVQAFVGLLGTRDGFRAAFALFGLATAIPSAIAFCCVYDSDPAAHPELNPTRRPQTPAARKRKLRRKNTEPKLSGLWTESDAGSDDPRFSSN